MTNALSVYENFDGLQKAASALYKSGYFTDAKSEAQAMVKVMAGAEIGIQPFASMSGIHIIKGKPTLGANVIATLVKNDPRYDYHIITALPDQNTEMVMTWFEDGKAVGVAGFTIEEAKTAGLTGKDNWKKYTSDMLFARAISRGARRFAPGIFGGSPVYTPDEMGADTDEDGHIIDVTPVITHQHQSSEPIQQPPSNLTPVWIEKAKYSPTANKKIIDELYPQDADDSKAIEDTGPESIMTVDRACAMTNAGGVRYDDLTSTELSHRSGGINTGLKKPDLTPEKRKEYEDKLQAIKVILQARNDGSIT